MRQLILLFSLLGLIFFYTRIKASNGKEFYLIDDVFPNELTTSDRHILDSCLTIYHSSLIDSLKIKALSFICENIANPIWENYQFLLLRIIEENMIRENKYKPERFLKEHLSKSINNVGIVYHNQGDMKKAMLNYKEALKIRREIKDIKGIAESLTNIGSLYIRTGKAYKSIFYNYYSARIFYALGETTLLAGSFNHIGNAFFDMGRTAKALLFFYKGFEMFEKLEDESGLSASLNNIAFLYRSQEKYERALEYFHKSLEISEKRGDLEHVCIRLNNISAMHDELEDYEASLKFSRQALNIASEIGHIHSMAISYNGLGSVYYKLGENEKALEYFIKSNQIIGKLGNKPFKAINYSNMSNAYLALSDIVKSKFYAKKAHNIALELGYRVHVLETAKTLAKVYANDNEPHEALKMYRVYMQMQDSLNKEEVNKKLAIQESKHLIEKKNHKIALLGKQRELKTMQLRLSLIIYSLILVFMVLTTVFLLKRRKNRYQKELNQLRELINEEKQDDLDRVIKSIPITYGKKLVPIDPKEVLFFNTVSRVVLLNHKNGKSYAVDFKITTLEKHLPNYFMRVHRSYIINTNEILDITKTYKGKVNFRFNGGSDKIAPSSIGYSTSVKDLIENFSSPHLTG